MSQLAYMKCAASQADFCINGTCITSIALNQTCAAQTLSSAKGIANGRLSNKRGVYSRDPSCAISGQQVTVSPELRLGYRAMRTISPDIRQISNGNCICDAEALANTVALA